MKIPRWVLFFLVGTIVLALIGALWLWLALPVRTARKFVSLVSAGKFDEANEIMLDARWIEDEGYVFLEADGRKVVLPKKDWLKAFSSDEHIGFFSRPLSDFVVGQHSFETKETRFGTYQFKAQVGVIHCDTDFDKLKVKTGWGFTAGIPHAEPLNVQGTYNWCDPKGGSIVLLAGEKHYGPLAACFGSGYFKFDRQEEAPSRDREWTVEFLDSAGKSIRKLQGRFGN